MKNKIDIIVPVKNSAKTIPRLLDSLQKQTFKGSFKVYMAIAESSDNSLEVIKSYFDKVKFNIIIIDNPHGFIPHGLNLLLKSSSSDLIIRVDAHSYVDTDYLQKIYECVGSNPKSFVSGKLITVPFNNSLISKGICEAQSSFFGSGPGSEFRYSKKKHIYEVSSSAFCGMKREDLNKIGFYDESFIGSEDDELNFRASKKGIKILVNPDTKVYYHSRENFYDFFIQYFYYGYHKYGFKKKYGKLLSKKIYVPAIFSILTTLMLASIFNLFSQLFLITILLLYSVISYGVTKKIKLIPATSIALLLMHYAYGMGYNVAIIRNLFKK